VRKHARRRANNGKKWSKREDAIITAFYPEYQEIAHRLKSRSYFAIRTHARQLGIVAPRHIWTNLEISKMRSLYRRGASGVEIAAAFPHLTKRQIASKARHLKLVRARGKCRHLGIPPIDAVRERAWRLGWTWRELDRRADTGRYFQQTTRQINWGHLAKAIARLGGRIEITWPIDQQPVKPPRIAGLTAGPSPSPRLP